MVTCFRYYFQSGRILCFSEPAWENCDLAPSIVTNKVRCRLCPTTLTRLGSGVRIVTSVLAFLRFTLEKKVDAPLLSLIPQRRTVQSRRAEHQNEREIILTTDERLEKVEGQLARVRWFNRCLIACIILTLGVWFTWSTLGPMTARAQSSAKEVRTTRFILEDENGTPRAELTVLKGDVGLFLNDENGKPCVTFGVDKGGEPDLSLHDVNGKRRAWLFVDKDGPRLSLHDENGMPRVGLGVLKDKPRMGLTDENGKITWSAS